MTSPNPEPAPPGKEPLSPPARRKSRGLVSLGRRGLRPGAQGRQAGLPLHRLFHLPLVPCHGARILRGRDVAALLNEAFVCVKVDREERPDIDEIYMSVCQMMTGSGGWPLTIVMTPERRPFFAATYIPKESRWGRQGLVELIPRLRPSGKRAAMKWRMPRRRRWPI